jgi:polar amino acid transport system substrate-binding protein
MRPGIAIAATAALILAACAATTWLINQRPRLPDAAGIRGSPAQEARDPAVVVLEADAWPPFVDVPAPGRREGYVLELAREAFRDAGRRVEFRAVPWQRAIDRAMSGACDGVIGASTTDGAGLVMPQQEMSRNFPVLLVRKGDPWRYTGPASLAGRRLGAIVGYDYRAEINDYIASHAADPARVQLLSDDTALVQNLRKLVDGRVDTIIDNEASLRWAARQVGAADRVEVAGGIREIRRLYVAFTPDDRGRKLAAEWDAGIARCRVDGTLRRILEVYDMNDWRKDGDGPDD